MGEETGGDGAVPLILHPVGLPSFPAREPGAADGVARLREIAARTTVHLWNGGYAGAPGVHLTAEELAWDLTWARTNPWDSGFSRRLQTSPTTDFPVLLTAVQAGQLGEDRMSEQGVLCLGYAGYTLAAPTSGTHRLWFLEGGRWKWLTSHVVTAFQGPPRHVVEPDGIVDCVHIIVSGGPGNDMEAVRAGGRWASSVGTEKPPALRPAPSPPRGTFFHSGIEGGGRWLPPGRTAAVAVIRASRAVSRDRTAVLLRAAAGVAPPPGGGEAPATGHDSFTNRELQGGSSGALRLDTDSVGAVFSTGRIAGLTYGKAPLTPAVRSQGFLQTTTSTRYLSTTSAAWFTGVRVRGVHEVAEIPRHVRLGITTFAMDQLPGLVLNVVAEGPVSVEETVVRQGVLEIPLCDIGDASTTLTGAVMDSSGRVREISVFPHLPNTLSDSESPLEWTVGAVGLRIDVPAASIWLIAAHPGAVLPVAFALGAREIPGGYRVSWYPVGFERDAVPDDSICSRWSASYRILATDRNSVVSPRVEHDLAEEIDGFTCQSVSDARSAPAT
ncbi:MAG: hypothetical protein WD492_06770 [Alkalispirochaeta sp.]